MHLLREESSVHRFQIPSDTCRQRRNFFYLTGCALPDCHLTYDVQKAELTLYIPPLDPSSVIWSGLPLSEEDALKIYDIDHCLPSNKLESYLSSLPAGTKLAHTGRGDLPIADSPFFQSADTDKLHTAIEACRVRKDEYEVALLRHANAITTAAHTAVLQAIPGASNEQELEGRFIEQSIAHGAKEQAYHGIFGSGSNAATLHYQNNDEPLAGRRNLLVDAAAEWSCYCADVTRTMPLLGKFDMESESIYVIVQSMQEACFKLLRADVAWEDVHIRAHEVAVEGLLALGILKGDKTEIMAARTSVAFFPHGLGHYLGLDTHDCGGNPNYEDSDPMFKYLRVRGQVPEGAVVTVEPGVYFCRFIIEPYLKDEKQSRFIDQAVLDKYWDVGGVRIEGTCKTSFLKTLTCFYVIMPIFHSSSVNQ